MEDTPVKGLYALAFVLSSFAASAQTPVASTLTFFEFDHYFGEIAELSTLPPQIIATEPMTGKSSEAAHETDGVTGSGENNREEAPVGAIQPSDHTASVQSANWWDDKLSFEETSEPSPASAQIVTPAPTIETTAKLPTKRTVLQ